MQNEAQIIWLVVCVVIGLFVLLKLKKLVGKLIILGLVVAIFFGGSKAISLKTAFTETTKLATSVANMIGENYIKVVNKTVLVKLADAWYDVSKISVSGKGDSLVINYDGEPLDVGGGNITKIMDALTKYGLIDKEN